MSWKYPVPDPECPECGEPVAYRDRTKCRKCGEWYHKGCTLKGASPACMPCAGLNGIVDSFADDLELNEQQRVTAMIIVAAMRGGADVDRVAEATGLPRELVESKARNLEASGIWKNGHMHVQPSDPETDWTEFILMILCADGLVVRPPGTSEGQTAGEAK